MSLARIVSKVTPGYEVIDIKEWFQHKRVDIYLKKKEGTESCLCSRCGDVLGVKRGSHPVKVKHLPIFHMEVFFHFRREKRHCSTCNKARSEQVGFISKETPHLSVEYSYWLGRLCEISSVREVSRFSGVDKSTLMRADLKRLVRMFQNYKIPRVSRICVDEVYARSKSYHARECRDNKFFTVICDVDTRRVIWVSESRNKAALDEFFHVIGEDRCKDITVVSMDQHDPYRASVHEHCPQADVVWDRFHIMQSFERVINEERIRIHAKVRKGHKLKDWACGRYKYLFLKKAKDRTDKEQRHIDKVAKKNKKFFYLELIKEKMLEFFYQRSEEDGLELLCELKDWIDQAEFKALSGWHENFMNNWGTIKNWFKHKVTSALAEGMNNVIKVLKRRAYGYRNMAYFKLKILQVCGFLNSRFIPMEF